MPPQARLGDKALIPADAHGCPACPHTATGPAVAGSRNVLVNDRPAIRVGDPGIHAACCGPNTWNAKTGSGSVLINGRAAHRLGDLTKHCGGIGRSIEGSQNVYVGDSADSKESFITNGSKNSFDNGFILVIQGTKEPISNQKYKLTTSSGKILTGITDANGKTARLSARQAEVISVEFPED